jgi:hypothetical protein
MIAVLQYTADDPDNARWPDNGDGGGQVAVATEESRGGARADRRLRPGCCSRYDVGNWSTVRERARQL